MHGICSGFDSFAANLNKNLSDNTFNMNANFHINYHTQFGENISIRFRRNGQEETVFCQNYDIDHWRCSIQITENEAIEYKYLIKNQDGKEVEEHGQYRSIHLPRNGNEVFFQDYWRPQFEPERSFFSAAFKDVIFRRNTHNKQVHIETSNNKLVFQLYAAAIPPNLRFCLMGNVEALGNWHQPILLSDENFPCWQAEIEWGTQWANIEYKYGIYDPENQQIIQWEEGENRHLNFNFPSTGGCTVVRTDEHFRSATGNWRGAGVAIPVFSLRSENGCGIGEFNDLKLLTDWAVKTGLKVVQTLPVNDTIATKKWTDSYPYAAISVFALHPLYVNLQSIAKLKNQADEKRLQSEIAKLNKSETVDFEGVLKTKMAFFKLLFEQEKAVFFKHKSAMDFIEDNADWLKPYAAFCHLRDVNGTTNFNTWPEHSTYSEQAITKLCDPRYKHFDEVAIYYFIQYHAHLQLLGATNYARQHGVVLKGDLPIGIYRESCDAWVAPHLYNMDGQAGAPPDLYAVDGQNWGFPTYNWEVMAKNGFRWWQQRMGKLAEYFDALRIDHILGFFRIWQIPTNQTEGTMGLFNPRLPYSLEELQKFGLQGDLSRYLEPYIRGHFLREMFGEDAEFVVENFLEHISPGIFRLRKTVDNQLKIKELFTKDKKLAKRLHLEKPLKRLVSEVLLLKEPGGFNPRITIHATHSYQDLSQQEKAIFDRIYDDYFQVRHDEFWKQQALWKLPSLLKASNMLICGEDLGMIPRSVPGVMRDLNIISLKIQRAPSGPVEFDDPSTYPWTSVCSPSCHDMSTIRGWWEEDQARAQRFLNNALHIGGAAPAVCTTGVVEAVDQQHLVSPSILAIFPIQDLVGMDGELRRPDTAAEQINDPSIVPHYWRFRFHLTMEELLKADGLNEKIREMVGRAGR